MRVRHSFPRLAAQAALFAVLSVFCSGHSAWAQAQRTIHLIVPFPPGGSADILARTLGEQISKAQGPTVLVENRPGAGSSVAYDYVARSAPDGNTLTIVGNSLVINPLVRKVPYDASTSFEPVCYLVRSPQVIVVNGGSPWRTLRDLVTAAHADPGKYTVATVGPATTQHIGVEQFMHLAGIDMIYVPYAGGAPAATALLGGHVDSVLGNYSEAAEQLNAGTLRALAATSRTRIPPLPDVPTVAELGYGDYDTQVWFGVVAPAKTPKETTAQLADWFTAALQVPEVSAKLVTIGLYPVATCGADFASHISNQTTEYGRIIREANIKVE